MGKRRLMTALLLLGILAGVMLLNGEARAAGVKNLIENKEYKFNLDQKGKKESLSYSMTKEGIYKIKINGKTVKKIKLNEDYYSPHMQVLDINKNDGRLNIWVYAYSDSEDIRYSALYEYCDKKVKMIWGLREEQGNDDSMYMGCCGFITSTNGKGRFTVAMDRAVQCDLLTGNHFDKVVFCLENGKVRQISDKTYYFYETYGSNNSKDKSLITAGKTTFYEGHGKSTKIFTIKKGVKCYPEKMYIEGNERVWVLFKINNGKKGWLCTDDFSFDRLPFSDMIFAD